MTASKLFGLILFAGIIGLAGLEIGQRVSTSGQSGLVSKAEAKIGRPLTPVSVAGVARRTARRCRAGVYNC